MKSTRTGRRLLYTILVVGIGLNLTLLPAAYEGLGKFKPSVGQSRDLGDRLATSGNRLIRGTFLLHYRIAQVVGVNELSLPPDHALDERLFEMVWRVEVVPGDDLVVSPDLRETLSDERILTIVDRSGDVYHLVVADADQPFCLAVESGDEPQWLVGPCALVQGSTR